MFSFIAWGFCLIAIPCFAAMVSKYDKRDNAMLALFFTGLFGAGIFLAAVPAIATSATGPDHLRSSTPVENVQSYVDDIGEISYTYTFNGTPVTDGGIDGLLPSTNGKNHLDKVCDETPDWVVPYTIGTCHKYLYVTDFASK